MNYLEELKQDIEEEVNKLDCTLPQKHNFTNETFFTAKDYKEGYFYYKQKYQAIENSTFWKISQPVRNLLDIVRGNKKDIIDLSEEIYTYPKNYIWSIENIKKEVMTFSKVVLIDFLGVLMTWIFYNENHLEKYQKEKGHSLSLEELKHLMIPRYSLLGLIKDLKKEGKIVYLYNNTQYPSKILKKILEEYDDNDYLILSYSECQKRQIDFYVTTYESGNSFGKKKIEILTPKQQFEKSKQYKKFINYINEPFRLSIANSIILGLVINQFWYNKPDALTSEGYCKVCNLSDMANSFFAPLLIKFIDFISNTSQDNEILLFLSREGYFLKKLYETYISSMKKDEKKNIYFLTSRRASSIAQITDFQSLHDILQTSYTGCLSNFFKERFGLDFIYENDPIIFMPKDKKIVLKCLLEHFDIFSQHIKEEKENYIKYIDSIFDKEDVSEKISVVDIGYSGTIQYNLMSLYPIISHGYYMVVSDEFKPEKLDGTCFSLYTFSNSPTFDKLRLFLEAILIAPHGQLQFFKVQDQQIVPVLGEFRSEQFENVKLIQECILRYTKEFGKIFEGMEIKIDRILVKLIFEELLRENILSTDLKKIFIVDDKYCMNGNWKMDRKTNDWKVES